MQTVLWLHAFPLSSRMFERQRDLAGVTHLMPDLPGFGSEPPLEGEPTMDAYARFAVAQLDARGIGKAVFAGVSMGGYIAFSALRLFPERIAGLILIDTRETADTNDGRHGRFDAIAKIEEEGVAPLVDSMFPKMLTPEAPADMKERVRTIMMSTPPRGAIDALKAIANRRDATQLLSAITVPTLVLVGEADTITPPSDAERMAKAIPGAKLVKIANVAHLSNVEHADAFNAAVAAFL
jgi:3-oxoadipate enol-lactonase